MSRKKTAKRSAKATSSKSSFATVQQIEKEILLVPSKLAAQHTKEIASLKQQESKLKAALAKTQAQAKKAESQIKAVAAKSTQTAASKKQMNKAKKSQAVAAKTESMLTKQLNQISKALAAVSLESTKLNALRKHIGQFGKLWSTTVKELKAKAKTKTKTKAAKPKNTSKRKANQISSTAPATTPADSQSHMTTYELEDAYIKETNEETV